MRTILNIWKIMLDVMNDFQLRKSVAIKQRNLKSTLITDTEQRISTSTVVTLFDYTGLGR